MMKEYDVFFDLARETAKTRPLPVLLAFYDLNVSMRPEYPVEKNCSQVLSDLEKRVGYYIALIKNGAELYPSCEKTVRLFLDMPKTDVKDQTGAVYGRQWGKFDFQKQFEYAKEAVINRIQRNGFPLSALKDKYVIDIGCGSGRFACALASFGPREVVAYDWGDEGLDVGRRMIRELGIKNVTFKKGSVLSLPYDDESFDFCFANGVFHHTEDMWKGIREQFRVTKRGGAGWLYIYGDGGFFWNARRRMREAMRSIPERYTESFLNLIDHDKDWFLPMDSWYVPIEMHTSAKDLERFLEKTGYKRFVRTKYGLPGDRTLEFLEKDKLAPLLFGDGDLRYILYKQESAYD